MASTIVTKNSSTASAVPVTGDLTQGELAVNVTDKKLYTKDSGGTVVKLVGSLGNQEASAVALTGGSINGTTIGATTASTGAFTTLSASGATTLSGGTANGVAYLNGSKVVTTGSALTFDGTNLGVLAGSVTSPAAKIHAVGSVRASTGAGTVYSQLASDGVYSTGTDLYLFAPTGYSNIFYANNSEGMRLTSTGLGIGTSSPAGKLHVNNTGVGQLVVAYNGTSVNYYDADTQVFRNGAATERARIDSSGNLLVGTTSADGTVTLKGSTADSSAYVFYCRNSSNTGLGGIRNDGYVFFPQVYNNTTASAANVGITSSGEIYRSTSSLKYKTNVQDAVHGLAEVLQLRPVTYKGKSETDGNKVFGGLIAEEVDEVGLTEFVQYADDGTPDALAYGHMVSLAFKAIQEQQALITQLTERITALEGK